ncbi:class I SAM-dependent methyltransferase [Rickettsia endosymbiont of Oedothorax gibbosus]|uniref:class I SAM-dependent methyltransferase n=1 Tax=Rickettsia endosymbiont of Oedothorax gibbosus TaxID=931099 RepID=UPI002024C143|nr:class I SAM-dependent methyltransferase [Rickettsia endosymbiont of Oedothorax gibbosus]
MDIWKLSNIANSYSETKEYRFNNYVVNPHIKNLIGSAKDKALLEVGCGFGRYLEIFSKECPLKLVGCDLSYYQIELCKQYIQNNNIGLHVLDFSDSASPEIVGQGEYDIVFNIFVILYIDTLEKLKAFITNCYKCLKKGGKVLICTLDILSASFYPEVFSILKLPTKPLHNNQYSDGCPIEISITNDCVVRSYQRDFDTLKSLMTEAGFKNIKKYDLFLDKVALQVFTDEELNIIKKSNILLLITAEKLND